MPVEEPPPVRVRVQEDAKKVRSLLPALRGGLAATMIAMHLGATLTLTYIVFTEPFPYPSTYVLMGLVLFFFLVLRLFAQASSRHFASVIFLLLNFFATTFFVLILLDQIEARPLVVDGRVVFRDDVFGLFVPIAFYSVVILLLPAQTFVSWWHRRRISRQAYAHPDPQTT